MKFPLSKVSNMEGRSVAESAALATMPTTYVHVVDEVNHTERRYTYPWPLADCLRQHGEVSIAADVCKFYDYADSDGEIIDLGVSVRHDGERCITIRYFVLGDAETAREELADIMAGRLPGNGPWGIGGAA